MLLKQHATYDYSSKLDNNFHKLQITSQKVRPVQHSEFQKEAFLLHCSVHLQAHFALKVLLEDSKILIDVLQHSTQQEGLQHGQLREVSPLVQPSEGCSTGTQIEILPSDDASSLHQQ